MKSDLWMLRIGGEVLGPLTSEDIKDKIKAHQITGIDEVAKPCAAWYYLRDLDIFLGTLEKVNLIRSESDDEDSDPDEEIVQTVSNQKTLTVTALEGGDETMKVVDVIQMGETKPIDDDELLAENMQNVNDEKAVLNLDKLKEMREGQNKKNKRGFFLILLILICLLSLLTFFFKSNILITNAFKKTNTLKDARKSFDQGDYRKALKNLKLSVKAGLNLKDLEPVYVGLLLLKEKNIEKAEKALAKISNKNTAEWKNLNGLVKAYKEDFLNAEKDFLNALSADQFYTPAVTNLGLISREKKAWTTSKNYFESAYSKGAETDSAAFLYAESWIKESMAKGRLDELQNVEMFLNNHLTMASSYSLELGFLQIWVKSLRGFNVEDEIINLLKMDPYLTELRKGNIFNYQVNFKNFNYICNDLNDSKNSTALFSSSIALCFALSGEEKRSLNIIEGSLLRNPGDANLLALKTFVYDSIGEVEKASLSLSESMVNNGSDVNMLPLYMQAHFCQRRGDYKCSSKFWQKVLVKDIKSASAYAGLGKAYYEVGAKDKALNLIRKAGSLNPDLTSYLELDALLAAEKK